MPNYLPSLSTFPLPATASDLIAQLDAMSAAGATQHGYLRIERSRGQAFLFLLQGKPFSAGTIEEERFVARSIDDFFTFLPETQAADYCATDLPLFLCAGVLFRKAPAAQIPSDLMDSKTLLHHIRQTGKDAVLVVRRGASRSLAFCLSGDPAALYPAPGVTFPEKGTIAERICAYVYGSPNFREITIDLYDEISLPAMPGAGQSLQSYLKAVAPPVSAVEASLVVRLGERTVFRYPVTKDVISVGRGGDNDLPLDNLSVSRKHARATRDGEYLIVEDLSSENGLTFGGRRVTRAELSSGDKIEIGKYTLVYIRDVPPSGVQFPVPLIQPSRGAALEETITLQARPGWAYLEHRGQRITIRGSTFAIGTHADAHLKIAGFFIAPVHATITRDRLSTYRIDHLAGRRKLLVNGRAVRGAVLRSGDTFNIGREFFTFVISSEAPRDQAHGS